MAQMNVSRRSFLAASTAAAGAIVLALGGCGGGGNKEQGAAEGKAVEGGTLTAAIAYSTANSYTRRCLCCSCHGGILPHLRGPVRP